MHTIVTRGMGDAQQLITQGYGEVGGYLSILQDFVISEYRATVWNMYTLFEDSIILSTYPFSLVTGMLIRQYLTLVDESFDWQFIEAGIFKNVYESIQFMDYLLKSSGFSKVAYSPITVDSDVYHIAQYRRILQDPWNLISTLYRQWDGSTAITNVFYIVDQSITKWFAVRYNYDSLQIQTTFDTYVAVLQYLLQSLDLEGYVYRTWESYNAILQSVTLSDYRLSVMGKPIVDLMDLESYLNTRYVIARYISISLQLIGTFYREMDFHRYFIGTVGIVEYLSNSMRVPTLDQLAISDNLYELYSKYILTQTQMLDQFQTVSQWYRVLWDPIQLLHYIVMGYSTIKEQAINIMDYVSSVTYIYIIRLAYLSLYSDINYVAQFYRTSIESVIIDTSIYKWVRMIETLFFSINDVMLRVYMSSMIQLMYVNDRFSRVLQFYRTQTEMMILTEFYTWWTVLSKYITVYLKGTVSDILLPDTQTDIYTLITRAALLLKGAGATLYTKIKGD